MPPQASSTLRPTVDDIFNYDAGIDATFNQPTRDWNVQDDTLQQQQHVPVDIDQEIKVTKKRKPVAKLDETRYVNNNNPLQHSSPFPTPEL
jgi:replication fork protection complex subunit Csm3/Swi3